MSTQTGIVRRPVLELVEASKSKFEGRLPPGMTGERFMYGLATSIQKNPALARCQPQSVILAAYEAAEVGCNLSPSLALGWIIPYGEAAQFQPSYRFFIQKAYETGTVASFFAEVVYANDHFVRQFAPKRSLMHAPPKDNDRGEAIGAYALVEFKDGHLDWEYMTKDQIERHRKASKQPDSMMWKSFWEEGWKKTPIRVLAKRLPMSNPGLEKLAEMVNRDAERESDPIIPGNLEIEAGTALPQNGGNGAPKASPAPQQAPQATQDEGVYYQVGQYLTTISGPALRRRFTSKDGQALGLKIDGTTWTIPAASTHQFVELCQAKGIPTSEIGSDGVIIPKPFEPTNEDLPDMFPDEMPTT